MASDRPAWDRPLVVSSLNTTLESGLTRNPSVKTGVCKVYGACFFVFRPLCGTLPPDRRRGRASRTSDAHPQALRPVPEARRVRGPLAPTSAPRLGSPAEEADLRAVPGPVVPQAPAPSRGPTTPGAGGHPGVLGRGAAHEWLRLSGAARQPRRAAGVRTRSRARLWRP